MQKNSTYQYNQLRTVIISCPGRIVLLSEELLVLLWADLVSILGTFLVKISEHFVLLWSIQAYKAVSLQQYSVQSVFIVNMSPGHQNIFPFLQQIGAITGVGNPDVFPTQNREIVLIRQNHLHIITCLLPHKLLADDSSSEHCTFQANIKACSLLKLQPSRVCMSVGRARKEMMLTYQSPSDNIASFYFAFL